MSRLVIDGRAERIARARNPLPRDWYFHDQTVQPGAFWVAIWPCSLEPARWAGFEVTPANPFIVEAIEFDGQVAPMAYPFSAVRLLSRDRGSYLVCKGSASIRVRNTSDRPVPATIQWLRPEDLVDGVVS